MTDAVVFLREIIKRADGRSIPDQDLIGELELLATMLEDSVIWPLPVREAAERVFGGKIHNPKGRTYGQLDRRIQHALRQWRERYGPLSVSQHEYATSVLVNCFVGVPDDGRADGGLVLALWRLDHCVNHEVVDAGFKKRREQEMLSHLEEIGDLVAAA